MLSSAFFYCCNMCLGLTFFKHECQQMTGAPIQSSTFVWFYAGYILPLIRLMCCILLSKTLEVWTDYLRSYAFVSYSCSDSILFSRFVIWYASVLAKVEDEVEENEIQKPRMKHLVASHSTMGLVHSLALISRKSCSWPLRELRNSELVNMDVFSHHLSLCWEVQCYYIIMLSGQILELAI